LRTPASPLRVRGGDGGGEGLLSEALERPSSKSRVSDRRRNAPRERGETGCRRSASARVTPKLGCGAGRGETATSRGVETTKEGV
jgi:hypothetical protein